MSESSWLENIASRWDVVRRSLRPARLCIMASFALRFDGLELHAERETHRPQDVADLVQGLAPEVLRLEHVLLGLLHEVADGPDARVLQTVRAADGELELV